MTKPTLAYRNQLAQYSLLSFEEEQAMFRELNRLKTVVDLVRSDSHRCVISDAMVADSIRSIEQYRKLRDGLIQSNLRLVMSLANRYVHRVPTELDELIGIGNAAIIRAVDGFDYQRGHRFSTYAFRVIQRAMLDGSRKELRYQEKFIVDGNESSENWPVSDESVSSRLEASESLNELFSLLAKLDEREQQIVKMRFGIHRDDETDGAERGRGVAFHEIARVLKISTTRTAQLFHRSLARLRKASTEQAVRFGFGPDNAEAPTT